MNSSGVLTCLLTALIAGEACQTRTVAPDPAGYDYFPLQTGHYIVYDVQEQRYLPGATIPVDRTYQLKEVVGAAYTDITGQQAYRLLRYHRQADGKPWQTDSIWSARQTDSEAIRTENGLDFVNLRFPVSDRLRWNGNRYNALGNDEYEVRNSQQPYRVSDKQFSETVTVVVQEDSTLLAQDKRMDVYARALGLIYKERIRLQYCATTPTCIGQYQIDYGIRQIYRIRSSGSE
ncbi:hypothetical protein [Spirosoma utsteinense]|uniref:Uncharacterized protein n=1 Tax=Spirosoma utsteinense TaxID=2585773 RepID=A0ABR6WBW0_9BACT|nr:hypothetical protein [Spirosoma utsteinense]MBC3786963.1 hypothetical protein [Spirosoma utsteinense]MBC3794055.1 hypothetical protein [Spirosoma utsteinense]